MSANNTTLIVGAGQAGLSVSYFLTMHGLDHIILEQKQIAEAWRSDKWDSFTLVTPNWTLQLPGFAYRGNNPDGFLTREEVVQYLEDYAASFDAPVQTGVTVTSVQKRGNKNDYAVKTSNGPYEVSNVVVATGTFQKPKIPRITHHLPSNIQQIHSSQYKNPDQLPPGAVLVIGSAQSGCQIAQELNEHGRQVFLSTGGADRLPRRYRGKDSFWWAEKLGIFNQTVDQLPSQEARFNPNPQVSGKDGGKTLSLQHLAENGVELLGRLQATKDRKIFLKNDLKDNMARADKFDAEFKKGVDMYIEKTGMKIPEQPQKKHRTNYNIEDKTELHLEKAGITSTVWATGYKYDYSWIKLPVLDDMGYPIQNRGVTKYPGLYFVGLHWLHTRKSGLLLGVGEDAAYVASQIVQRS
ncbi:MAG: SidA/IucD/PvdA family monooxygenase [Caldithrix sp.]|nr:SidA/IucD/PvdA family monooxygenase [Caldithrix sp.]